LARLQQIIRNITDMLKDEKTPSKALFD